jgi:Domain of unknown function (DUF4831)
VGKRRRDPSSEQKEKNPMLRRIALLLVLLAAGCTRSFQVYDAKQLKTGRDYLFYALPRNVVVVDVPVRRIDQKKDAPCKDDSANLQLLGLDPPPRTDTKKFVALAPTVATRSEPDPDQIYAIDLRFRPFANTSGAFEMSDNGVLTTETVSQEDKSLDTVLSVVKLGVAAATGLPTNLGAKSSTAAAVGAGGQPVPPSFCSQVASDIREIRAQRTKVLANSIAREGATKEYTDYVLGQLDTMEGALIANFSGETQARVATVHCEIRPEKSDAFDLFRFSADDGVLEPKHCFVPPLLRGSTSGGPSKTYVVRVATDGAQFADAVRPLLRVSNDPRGFFYRIPAAAVVTVELDQTPQVQEFTRIAQLGTTATLPTVGGAFVRKAAMTPTLNAAGGLQKLTLNGEPAGPDAANSLIGIAGSLHDAQLQKQADAAKTAAAASDELAQLTRQRQILEEKKKIQDIQAALAQGTP